MQEKYSERRYIDTYATKNRMSCLQSGPCIDAPPGGAAAIYVQDPRDKLRDSLRKTYSEEQRSVLKTMARPDPGPGYFAIPGAEWIRSHMEKLRDAILKAGIRVSPPEYSPIALPVRCSWDSSPDGIAMANYCVMVQWAGTDVIPHIGGGVMLRDGRFAYSEPTAAEITHNKHLAACRTRDALCARHGLSPADAEAVLARKDGSFPKDTLAALRAINEFARANGIRFEDAEQVLQEVIGH